MESLLASYASSDEDEDKHQQQVEPSRIFSSLPLPKLKFRSKNCRDDEELQQPGIPDKTSSLFSVLPPPKTTKPDPPPNPLASSDPKPKRVVQFKPPLNPFSTNSNTLLDENDEEDADEKEKQRKRSESESEFSAQTSSVKSFLSTIPSPKNSTSLGVLGSGSGRRKSTIESDVPVPIPIPASSNLQNESGHSQSHQIGGSFDGSSEYSHGVPSDVNYGTYTGYEHYGHNWTDESTATTASAITNTAEVAAFRLPGKRGRSDVPQKIVEVNQDELMKNRPREDQTRLTGIAFGPSYQPVSSKGKPSKLLKRKHQIGTLYFDMKQKEMELAERRARGMQTKAQTQGKYGW